MLFEYSPTINYLIYFIAYTKIHVYRTLRFSTKRLPALFIIYSFLMERNIIITNSESHNRYYHWNDQ